MNRCVCGVGLALLVASGGCSSTRLDNTWSAANVGKPVHHVLVVAMGSDDGMRRDVEQDMAARLAKAGVQAQRSSEFVEHGPELTPQKVGELVQRTGADAVLISEVVGVSRTLKFEASTAGWYPYYSAAWPAYYGPGDLVESRVVHASSRLYSARPGEGLMWSTTSETSEPSSSSQAIASVNAAVVKKLGKDGLI